MMLLRRYHPRPEVSPGDEDEQTSGDEQQANGPPENKRAARSAAARSKSRG